MSAVLRPGDGGPAFPAVLENSTGSNLMLGNAVVPPGSRVDCLGMSLRDYFAANLMPHLLDAAIKERNAGARFQDDVKLAADAAYLAADAMLKARQS